MTTSHMTRTVTYSSSNGASPSGSRYTSSVSTGGPSRAWWDHSSFNFSRSSNSGSRGTLGGLHNRPSSRPNWTAGSYRPTSYGGFYGSERYPPLITTDDKPQVTSDSKDLRVTKFSYDLHDNRRRHHTDEYEDYALYVRRGQEFTMDLDFNREVNLDEDNIVLQFTVGTKPKRSKGTLVQARKSQSGALEAGKWGYYVRQHSGNSLKLGVQAGSDAVVGVYTLFVNMSYKDNNDKLQSRRHKIQDKITILFNAWCKEDAVFMPDDEERKEYVLNETGRVYVGSNKKISARPWNFGQFERCSIEAALLILEKSYLTTEGMGNPTHVTRALSAIVNNCDNSSGVLEGNWSGSYFGGKSPTAWNGSVAILEEYMLSKRPVKFGQCWVFSGLCTTMGRALGIPTRSVTNFQSAHDKDISMTIDHHRGDDGRPLSDYSESVWNFHVWNEGWFARPDLPDGNDGWQAFDATPQEQSGGMMRCGPAPVKAIKEGNVFYGYDAPFIYAEVNGDQITWLVDDQGDIQPISASRSSVGFGISTKAVGSRDRQDVTNHYKYPEGSKEERQATSRAWKYSSRRDDLEELINSLGDKDCKFDMEGIVSPNGDICVKINMESISDEDRTVKVRMFANAKYYTGIPGEEIEEFEKKLILPAKGKETVEWDLRVTDYLNRLDEDAMLGIYSMVRVQETGQCYSEQDTYNIDKPDLDLKVIGSPKKGQQFQVEIRFTNPLATRLTGCRLFLEGPGVQKELNVQMKRKTLNPNEEFVEKVTLTPRIIGTREIIANLHSQQVTGITGVVEVTVKE